MGSYVWNYRDIVVMCFHLSRIKVLKLYFGTVMRTCFDIIKNVARCIQTLFGTILELQRNFEKRGR